MMLINSTDAHLCYQPLKAPLNDSQMFLLCIFTVHVNTVIFSLSSFNCCNSKHLLRLTIQSGFGPVTYHCCFYSQDLFSSIRINTLFALNFEHQILCYLNKMNLHHLCNLIKKSFHLPVLLDHSLLLLYLFLSFTTVDSVHKFCR